MPRLFCALLFLLAASSASGVVMTWTPIANPGNACDPKDTTLGLVQGCWGSVSDSFHIGTYEVTNAQYTEFLNAKAASDPLGLYNPTMASPSLTYNFNGGITRGGSDGSYTYAAIAGRENNPVNHVSFYDALRFANWMNNGQGSGDTESGAYTLLGGTATPSNGTAVTRNPGATVVLPSGSEWYKAAYYDPSTASYFNLPTSSDTAACSAPTATPNRMNCNATAGANGFPRSVGSYIGSASPYGTFDQGGNIYEWSETIPTQNTYTDSHGCGPNGSLCREIFGGSFLQPASWALAGAREAWPASAENSTFGFRLAYIPEPSTGLLVIAGLLGFGGWRRATG